MLKVLKNNKGVALLITLTFIAVAVTGSIELSRKVRSSVFQTGVIKDKITASYMASSGINTGITLLIKDRSQSDTELDCLLEDWANPDKINDLLNDIPFDMGDVSVIIQDELSKIQVNALVKFPNSHNFNNRQKDVWHSVLSSVVSLDESFNEIIPISLINATKDWLDSGDDDAITGLTGAESEYYKDLTPPYLCGNGLFRDINELMLVKGFTKELVYGVEEIPGISDYMTVSGMTKAGNNFTYQGKININTADIPVIAATLPLDKKASAQAIYDFREAIEYENISVLSDINWYKQAPGCSDLNIDSSLICVSSDIFRIESKAKLNDMEIVKIAVVRREQDSDTGKWFCRILRCETK